MKVADVIRAMESLAPPGLAADWDNVGLQVGDPAAAVRRVLVCVDLTEAVLEEAARAKVQMIVAHHPAIFRAIKQVTPEQTPVAYAAVRRGVAVYAAHTNLDAAGGGTSDVLADSLGLTTRRPLEPIVRSGHCKVVVFLPPDDLSRVADAAFAAGAGRIGDYFDCAFFGHGVGAFRGGEGAQPTIGLPGRSEVTEELRLEMICPHPKTAAVCQAIRDAHSYEEPAIDVYLLQDCAPGCGHGRVGALPRPATVQTLINRLKKATGLRRVVLAARGGDRAGDGKGVLVSTAACAAGDGGGLLRAAVAQGATFFATGELRHHEMLDALALGLTVVCLGHGNSERLAMRRLAQRLAAELPAAKVIVSRQDKDPSRQA